MPRSWPNWSKIQLANGRVEYIRARSARLPANSNLTQLKKQARDLLRAYQSGDSEIIDCVLAVYTPKAKDLVGNVLWTSSWNLAQISIGIDEEYRSTLMGWAAREGQEDMVDILLKRGADPNGGEEWTKPLVWAERRGYKDVANALKKAGASA